MDRTVLSGRFISLCAALFYGLLAAAPATAAPIDRTVCVWDIAGNAGPTMAIMREWRIEALSWGLNARLVVHTNEGIATEELKAGQCDAAVVTDFRARPFNQYTGTINAIGAIPDFEHLRLVLQVLAHPQSADKMTQGPYTVMGIAPAGGAYIFVNDRNINTLAKAAGKKFAVLEHDPMQAQMVARMGATPVGSDVTNFSSRFNNGQVDIIAAPLIVYNPLELYRGLSPDGAIIDYPLLQVTLQMIGRADRFPAEIAQKSRDYFFRNYDQYVNILEREAEQVDPRWMEPVPESDRPEYEHTMLEGRVELRDQGHYDGEMLSLQRRVRCRIDASRGECTNPVE
ncbi:putative solute-binding protein [Alcanivorax quisquiliarum]|uniref:DUF6091 family protein n=1 Tax=Alcanivorax quisquiliarum TaxID=2933565 RepID=A0ABT0EA82_9GAMM|nr:putative solute-binding protein [Alcanivorax quisquiliarum]MCK0538734.1 DUF6091 family protein [Alcanivorax quisquiliarum]